MNFKVIFSLLFLLVTTMVTIHAKPSPVWIDLDRASEGENKEKLTIESDKDEINSQLIMNGESQQNGKPDTSNERNRLIILDTIRCPWPPALCGDGGDFGEPH